MIACKPEFKCFYENIANVLPSFPKRHGAFEKKRALVVRKGLLTGQFHIVKVILKGALPRCKSYLKGHLSFKSSLKMSTGTLAALGISKKFVF